MFKPKSALEAVKMGDNGGYSDQGLCVCKQRRGMKARSDKRDHYMKWARVETGIQRDMGPFLLAPHRLGRLLSRLTANRRMMRQRACGDTARVGYRHAQGWRQGSFF